MNHIYKSIFNKALGVFTAVPEFASAHGKGSERTVVGRVAKSTAGFAASALAISVGLALTSTSAVAGPGIYINDGVDEGCMALPDAPLPKSGVYGISSSAVGYSILTAGAKASDSANLAYFGGNVMAPCMSTGNAAQEFSTQTNRTLFYGKNGPVSVNDNGAKNLTLGGRLDVNSGIIGVGDRGTNGAGATNSIRMGTGTTLDEANKYKNAIAIGVDTATTAEGAVAISAEAKARTSYSIAIGRNATAGGDMVPPSNETGGAIAIGRNSLSNFIGAVALGNGATVSPAKSDGNTTDGIAIGTKALVDSYRGMAIGANSQAKGTQSIVLANNVTGAKVSTASGFRSQVYGVESEVSGSNSVAMGSTNTVASHRTYAMGNNINVAVGADDSLVFGTKANVSAANAIAMGSSAQARTEKSVALGENALAGDPTAPTVKKGKYSTAIGSSTSALGYGATAVGSITKAKVNYATALGHGAEASGIGETSLGYGAGANSASANGNRNGVNVGTNAGRYAISGGNNVAVGISAGQYVEGDNNIAQGYSAGYYIKGNENVSIGTNANVGSATEKLKVSKTVAIGSSAKALTNDSVAIGTGAKSGKVDRYSGERSVAIGAKAEALGTGGIAIGDNAATTDGHNGVAIGVYSKTQNEKAISIGAFNKATGAQSIVIAGNYDSKNGDGVSTATAARATVIGAETNVSGEQSVAIGDKNDIASARTYALGNNINVKAGADDSLAFGTRAAVGAANTVAIGANANAAQANSVALGAGSTTANVHEGDYTLNGSYTAAGLPNAANGTVSVGSKGKERQIQNVAAGVISETSTDAINGSQLYATNNYLSNLAGDVKNVLGGNAEVNNAGNVTMSNIGGTGENTIDGAIKNLKTAIDSKADTTASVTSENAADIKVKKEAPVDNITNYKLSLGDDAKEKLAKAATALQTVEGDSNITATKDPADPTKVKLALKRDLTADSVTLGNTAGDQAVVNKDGLTITGGPSVKKDGINAGDKNITGVADGNVAAGSKDAVNGGQLAEVKAKADSAVQNVVSANPTALTVTKAGDTVTLTPNFIAGDLVNPATGEVNTPAADDAGKLVTAGTVAKALAETHFVVDTKATTGGELDGASQANQKIKSSNKVTLQAGKNLKAKQTNGTDGAQVEFSLKDSISLTQVTAGTGDNQVVLGKDGVQVGGNTYINKDGINAAGKAISNVANGNVAAYSKDAVNGGQLQDTAKSVADVIGGGATVKDGKVVAGQNGIGNTGQNTVHGAIAAINQNTANNFNQIRGDLRKMDRDLRGSIAGTLATAGLPQAFSPGKSMVAAAAGTYRGQSGLAVGVSRISDNGKVILKVTGNTNSRGDFGGTIGAGYQW